MPFLLFVHNKLKYIFFVYLCMSFCEKQTKLLFLFFALLSNIACTQNVNHKKLKSLKLSNMDTLSDAAWKEKLTADEYYILREKGTEKPFSGKFLLHKENGNYTCKACGAVLFSSSSKFDAHCGWPSFDKEIEKGKINYTPDNSHGMERIEITCANCGGHLGHVFNDGPTETGLRYCVNSVSLDFVAAPTTTLEIATFGGGCFWCTEAIYSRIDGVEKVASGYAGGHTKNPTYKEVCTGNTGHAEVIQIYYHPQKISYAELLKVFFSTHNPTTLNRQGNDVGTQYRSVIFYHNAAQEKMAKTIIDQLTEEKVYDDNIVTEITAFDKFYQAEDYHQDYYKYNAKSNSYCEMVIQPKVEKFEKVFKSLLKK